MIFDRNMIDKLRQSVKTRLSEKRYAHTLGVEKMAAYLGTALLPDKVDELRVSALLHDIAKEISYEEQISIIADAKIICTDEDISTKPALHSIAAVPVIQSDFAEYATPDVLSAVANHTLGNNYMSLFDEIIFISDYAEPGRTYRSCCEVREYLLKHVNGDRQMADNVYALHRASLMAIESTVDSLTRRGESINSRTLLTKKYLEEEILK